MESEALLKQAFGLNAYEAKVYISLLTREMKPSETAEASGVPLPRTYDTLRSLGKKGFVKQAGASFQAVRPLAALKSRLNRFSDDFAAEQATREEASRRILGELEPVYIPPGTEAEPVMLKGLDSIASAFNEVIQSSEIAFLMVRRGFEARAAFLSYLRGSGRKRRKIRVLVPSEMKIPERDLVNVRKLGLEVRRSDGVLLDMMVGGRDDVIFGVPASGRDESFGAVAIWVKNRSFSDGVLQTIRQLWSKAEKL